MTGHRDHAMLDIAVISALQELAGATQTRVLSIATMLGQTVICPRAVIRTGVAAQIEAQTDSHPSGEPLATYPELRDCLAHHLTMAERIGADGACTLWLPIWIGSQADSCLEIVHSTPLRSGSDTMQVIDGIVSVYRNFQNLLDYSERDALTGLRNRKTFDDELVKMLQSATAPEHPASLAPERRDSREGEKQWLAVIDVDHFKMVNDQFGHLYGDEVLILIANLLQSSFRTQDRVFRFGGEEFVVLLRSTCLKDAQKVIERFRNNVAGYSFPQLGTVTVSVGFVSISTCDAPVVTLGHADQALYYAKSHGRNQSCHYDQLVASGQLAVVASNDTAEFF